MSAPPKRGERLTAARRSRPRPGGRDRSATSPSLPTTSGTGSPGAVTTEPSPRLVGPRQGAADRARHRAGRTPLAPRLLAGPGWPVAALVVVGLIGARAALRPARPGEGTLTAQGVLLGRGADLPAAGLSPEGVGALHATVYGTVTRALDRHETLLAAGRELVLVAVLLSCVLLWRTARRIGLGDPAGASGVLLLGLGLLTPVLLPDGSALDGPALLAVPWLLLAGYLVAPGRSAPAALVGAVLATAVAVLLAPDVLLLVAAAGVAAAVGSVPRRVPVSGRRALAVLSTVPVVGVALLLDRWDPQPTAAAVLGVGTPAVHVASGVLVALGALAGLGGLSGWRLHRLRTPAVGMTAAAASVALSGRLPTLLVCLPLAALLAAGLGEHMARGAGAAWARPVLRVAAGLTLGIVGAAALTSLLRTPPADLGARDHDALVAWVDEQLHPDTLVVAPPRLRAELVHAGADPDQVRLPHPAGDGGSPAPVLVVVEEDPPAGSTPVARFGPSEGTPRLVLADPSPGEPTPEELHRRRTLAAALLTRPTTADHGRATGALVSAEVDPRLLTVLAGVDVEFGLGLASLPTVAGEESTGTLTRYAVLDEAFGAPLRPGAPGTERLLAWLDAQWPPLAPDTVEVADGTVRIGYSYVSAPDGVVTEAMS